MSLRRENNNLRIYAEFMSAILRKASQSYFSEGLVVRDE